MKAILRHKKFELYTRPYELNIVGLRGKSVIPNQFDDELHVFYKLENGHWQYHIFKATTDPGTFWLRNPMQVQGTAILAEGQYRSAYRLGLHRGKYLALVQSQPIDIIRDYNRDEVLDFKNGKRSRGMYGINIHRANRIGQTKTIDKNSAGCQVFENAADFDVFIKLCEKHSDLYGNRFTYSLIDFRAVNRQNARYIVTGLGILGLTGIGLLARYHKEKIKQALTEISHFFSEIMPAKKPFSQA